MRRDLPPLLAWGRRLYLALSLVPFLVGLAAMSCHANGGCLRGELCECSGGSDCYIGCADDDGCIQRCHSLDNQCGSVCGDGCSFECFDTNACSSSCGNDCAINCHNTTACGAFCGAGCDLRCTSVDRCGVEVGPGSSVECTSVTSCVVDCLGTCQVACTGVNRCEVNCPASAPHNDCGNGVQACGAC